MADISFLDMLGGVAGGATAPEGGETSMPESTPMPEGEGESESPMSILSELDISDIVDFLKSKEILPKDFTYEEPAEGEGEEAMEMPGEESTDESLSFDKLMAE